MASSGPQRMKANLPAFLLTLALTCGPIASIAVAIDLNDVLVDYTLTTWGLKDGLPSSVVWAIAQDKEGYLWLGTDEGPVRFDGARFIPWEPLGPTLLPKAPVRAICATRDGSIWFGLGNTGGVSRLSDGQLRNYGASDGLPDGAAVTVLLADPAQTVWAGTSVGLFVFSGDRWQRSGRGLPAGAVNAIYVDRAGRFLVGMDSGLFRRRQPHDDNAFERVGVEEIVRGIAEDAHGTMWVTDPFIGFRRADERRTATHYGQQGRGNRLLVDSSGNLWVGAARQGLWRVRFENGNSTSVNAGAQAPALRSAGARTPARRSLGVVPIVEKTTALVGFSDDGVTSLLQDSEGNIWAGTLDGLNRLTPHRITPVTDVGLVSGVEVTTDGAVWVGAADAVIKFAQGLLHLRRPAETLPGVVSAMHASPDGGLWAAVGSTLFRFDRGTRTAVHLPGVTPPQRITAITSDTQGRLWLSDADQGLVRWDGTRLTPVALPTDLGQSRLVAAETDRTRRMWLAFANGRVATVARDGTITTYGREHGLDAGGSRLIYEDDEGTIWLGGTEGLSRFADGRFVTLNAANGFPTESLTAVVEDDAGTFWLGTEGAGIVRIARAELDRALANASYRPRYRVFDKFDGFAGTPRWFGNRAAVRTKDGRLWFLAGRGVTVIDPHTLPTGPAPPVRVRIEGVVADDRRIPVVPRLTLPARTTRLQIDYAVLDLTSPRRTHFRYKLAGFDRDWIDAGSRRQAFYTNLPPREYEFRAMASNDDGTWSEAAGVWAFAIQPAFYQTSWFLAAGILGIAAIIGGVWRLHVRRVRSQFALLIGERARLSREIHDTLLQGLYGVALRCEAITKAVESSAPWLQQHFLQMRKDVQEYIHEARQSIQDLRSPRLFDRDLTGALRDFGERVTVGTPIKFELAVHGVPRGIAANVDQQLLRIAQEAVVNAVRHAEPHGVRVELCYDAAAVTLRVCDDGRGFDPRILREGEGHYGLVGMKERAASVGGTLHISSHDGRGAQVEAVVPAGQEV